MSKDEDVKVSKTSEFSLREWFNYWFKGVTLFVNNFTAVYNPQKFIDENPQLPDRLSQDYFTRIYRYNKDEYKDIYGRQPYDKHAPMMTYYNDCMQQKRGHSILGALLGGLAGQSFGYYYHFGTVANTKKYLKFSITGAVIGLVLSRFVISPRVTSCFEQILNQALADRINEKGYKRMMEYYNENKVSEADSVENWYPNQIDKEQSQFLKERMRKHMKKALELNGLVGDEKKLEEVTQTETTFKQYLDTLPKKQKSYRKHFKFI
ncbi:hypothetical protein ABK040_004335 [Willaertia magna]